MDILVLLGSIVIIVLLALGCISVANWGESDVEWRAKDIRWNENEADFLRRKQRERYYDSAIKKFRIIMQTIHKTAYSDGRDYVFIKREEEGFSNNHTELSIIKELLEEEGLHMSSTWEDLFITWKKY